MATYADVILRRHDDGRLEVVDPPPVGSLTVFSLELLALVHADGSGTFDEVGLDGQGGLVIAGLTWRPVGFETTPVGIAGPLTLVCERVA